MAESLRDLLDRITNAASGRSDDAGIRITTSYEPAGGAGTLIFPPTYPFNEDKYAMSRRHVDGAVHGVVVVDSIPSQANRIEQELQDAIDDGVVSLPYIETSGQVGDYHVRVTNLSAPHRGPDAYFRDSEDNDGTAFDDTDIGRSLRLAGQRNARAYYEYAPTDLVFGFWDSQRGGRGVKLARAYTSEIVGIDPEIGKRGAVRFDPNNITKQPIAFPAKHPEAYQVLATDDEGKPEKAPKGTKLGKPSEIGHGNVPAQDANPGVSVTAINRTAFVSLTALSALRFPDADGNRSLDADIAGRTVLACLALYGDQLAFSRASVFLRSGCDLVPLSTTMNWVGKGGLGDSVELSLDETRELLDLAIAQAAAAGLTWSSEPVRLRPKSNLLALLDAAFSTPVDEAG